MENISMTDINKTNEEIILECVKKIESDNATIHNQNVDYFQNKIKMILSVLLMTITAFCLSFTSPDFLRVIGILVFLISFIITTSLIINTVNSFKHIKK